MQVGMPAAYDCIEAFVETDFKRELPQIDAPTLVIHGDDDQIVLLSVGGARSAQMIKGAVLKVSKGASHGLITINKDQLNADLLEFAAQKA